MISIEGNKSFKDILPNMVGVHGDIPKVKGPMELYENRIKELVPPTNVALDVVLISIAPIGFK